MNGRCVDCVHCGYDLTKRGRPYFCGIDSKYVHADDCCEGFKKVNTQCEPFHYFIIESGEMEVIQ